MVMQYPVVPYSSSKAGSPGYAFLLSTVQKGLPETVHLTSTSRSPECAVKPFTPRQKVGPGE
jgi:hypothetical protein